MSSTNISCVICDDVRQETSGKSILIGTYNDAIIFPRSEWDKNGSKGILTQLFIANFISGVTVGPVKVIWWIEDPDGEMYGMNEKKKAEIEFTGFAHSLFLRISPVVFEKRGSYMFHLELNGLKYEKRFKVEIADRPPEK